MHPDTSKSLPQKDQCVASDIKTHHGIYIAQRKSDRKARIAGIPLRAQRHTKDIKYEGESMTVYRYMHR